MKAYLGVVTGGNDDDAATGTNRMAKTVLFLSSRAWVRPASRAAMFEAVRDVPGISVVPGARDAAGRVGIGVRWSYGAPMTMVFDPTSYRYLGSTFDAVLSRKIVDRVGQR
jgi:hypothetical protein